MKKNKLSIPSPCTQDWNAMADTTQGKFCQHCQHEVIDFSTYTDQQILTYIQSNANTCGLFTKKQLQGFAQNKPFFSAKPFWGTAMVMSILLLPPLTYSTQAKSLIENSFTHANLHQKNAPEAKNEENTSEKLTDTVKKFKGLVENTSGNRIKNCVVKIEALDLELTTNKRGEFTFEMPQKTNLKEITFVFVAPSGYHISTRTFSVEKLPETFTFLALEKSEVLKGKIKAR